MLIYTYESEYGYSYIPLKNLKDEAGSLLYQEYECQNTFLSCHLLGT